MSTPEADSALMARAGVPRLQIQHLGDTEPFDSECMDLVIAALAARRWLVLSSELADGKTAACSWALGREMGVFLSARSLLDVAVTDQAMFSGLGDTNFLVIDGLGREVDDTGKWLSQLGALVSTLASKNALLFITTWLSAEDFVQRYGPVAAKICEYGPFVRIKGESRRAAT